MDFEIKIDGHVAVKAEINPSLFRSFLSGTAPPFGVPKSAPLTAAQVEDLLSRIDTKSVQFLKQIAANNGRITWGDARTIFGIEDPTDWSAFSASYGKGITRAVRNILGDRSARLVWWDDHDKTWESTESKDPALLFVDGPALQALQQLNGVAGRHGEVEMVDEQDEVLSVASNDVVPVPIATISKKNFRGYETAAGGKMKIRFMTLRMPQKDRWEERAYSPLASHPQPAAAAPAAAERRAGQGGTAASGAMAFSDRRHYASG